MSRQSMHHYSQGKTHSQAHKGIQEGCYEEEQGRDGFYGPVSHLTRKAPSARWKDIQGQLKPGMYNLNLFCKTTGKEFVNKQSAGATAPLNTKWHRLLYNSSLGIYYVMAGKTQKLDQVKGFRNADGDLIYFCHKGRGEVFTEYGLLHFYEGCYVVMPKCLVHSFVLQGDCQFFVVESRSGYFREPERGMLGKHAVYDVQALQKPNLQLQQERQKKLQLNVREIEIRKSGELTRFFYESDIYDIVGWKGNLFPFVLDIKSIMPVMSHRAHLPPSVHTTFLAPHFVVCSFVPRPLETDADSLKVPFYHQNIDYDEVLFYHEGDFFSRDNLESGMMSLHPCGFPHGPHPKAFKSAKEKTKTNEYAVMVDSLYPLKRDLALSDVELADYWKSWNP